MCVVCIKTGKEGRSLNPVFFSIAIRRSRRQTVKSKKEIKNFPGAIGRNLQGSFFLFVFRISHQR